MQIRRVFFTGLLQTLIWPVSQPAVVTRSLKCRVLTALERHFAGFEDGSRGVPHCLRNRLLELSFDGLTRLNLGPHCGQICERGRQPSVVGEIDGTAVTRIQMPQGAVRGFRSIRRRRRIRFDEAPEARFELDEPRDQRIIALYSR